MEDQRRKYDARNLKKITDPELKAQLLKEKELRLKEKKKQTAHRYYMKNHENIICNELARYHMAKQFIRED